MPAFPQSFHSTVSHWQQTNRGPTSLWNHGRYAKLPTDEVVDYVIIGAGVSGTSLAYQLSRPGAAAHGKSVVILDAKDVASCASGRNGGHVTRPLWGIIPYITAPLEHGGAGLELEDAIDIILYMQDNLHLVERLIEEEEIDADFKKNKRFEVFTTPEMVKTNEELRKLFYDTLANNPKYKGRDFPVQTVNDAAEAQNLSRVKHALGLNRAMAGSWHPHKGVTALMRRALASTTSDVEFFSWAPVAGFSHNADGTVAVDCSARGTITARTLILASESYTHHLLPEFEGIITGYRLQAGLTTPPATFAGEQALDATYAIENGAYLIQTRDSGLLFGPYEKVSLAAGLVSAADLYGNEDDSVTTPKYREWLADYCRSTFAGWGDEIQPGEGLTKWWSGIVGLSLDARPWVGAVPGRKNVYMACGYGGMGMGLVPKTAHGLAQMLKTGKWDEAVPRCFEVTQERLDRVRAKAPHPSELVGESRFAKM